MCVKPPAIEAHAGQILFRLHATDHVTLKRLQNINTLHYHSRDAFARALPSGCCFLQFSWCIAVLMWHPCWEALCNGGKENRPVARAFLTSLMPNLDMLYPTSFKLDFGEEGACCYWQSQPREVNLPHHDDISEGGLPIQLCWYLQNYCRSCITRSLVWRYK